MNKKFISVFMIGAATLAPLSTFVSCNDYDDDIKDLQEQIAASGVDLKAEVSRLEGLLDACKAASEKADSELNEAIKNATNDAKGYADIQAAEAKKAAIEAAQSLIEKAIQDLENGSIKAAQAKADAAYLLAEQTSKVAGENKAELEKLAAGLATTNDNLTKAVAALNSRLDEANQAIAETKALAEDNQAKLAVLEAALQSLQASNQQAHDALNAKDNELKALIDANQQAIEATLNTKIAEVNTKISEANAKIAALETRVANNEVSLNEVKTDIANNIKPELVRLAGDISTIQNDIIAINNYLDILNQNLNNLITGLILQDAQLEMVQAQVVSDPGTIAGLTLKESRGGKTYIMFPYKDAKGGAEELTAGEWNVERVAGPVYYTINPTNVNFTDAANINLENSLEQAPANIAISAPKASERKSPITRAVEAPKNGLYQSTIENSDNHRTAAHPGFKNSYALYTSYVQTAKDGSTINKKVYSQYALNLSVVDAAVQDAPAIVAVGADNAHPATCDARFTTDYGKPLQGKLQLAPVNTEFGKDNGTKKVYKKYVEAIGVTDARGIEMTGTKLTTLLTAISNANPGVLNTIFEEDEAGFDEITVTIPDNAGDHSFIGNVITFRYFIQNYNGTIYATTYKVMFVKTLFEEAQVVIEHTPYAAGNNTTMHGKTKNDKTEFQIQANCITVAASNTLWKNNTAKIEVTAKPDANGAYLHIKNIYFHTASTSGSGWVAEAPLKTIPMNDGMSASVSGLTVTDMGAIKNMVIEYDPEAPNIVEHEYELEMKSFDPNGNLISKLPIKFTMNYPNHDLTLIKPNPAFFTPYNAKLIDADSLRAASYTLTAWANNNNGTNAKYNIIAAFNSPYSNADGCALSFDLANKAKYASDANLRPYAPVNAWRVNGPTDYWMEVPAKAVKFDDEYVYTLQLAVQNFGVESLWYNPVEFKVVFKSAIAHAKLAFNKETYEVGYPSQTLSLNDANVSADDKSTSAADDINYFAKDGATAHTRDARIKTTSVELVQTQFASLFKTISCTNDEIKIVTNEQVEGGVGSITTDRIQFNFIVEDHFGNVRKYPFYVKVKENN